MPSCIDPRSTQLLLYTNETESKNGVIKTKSFEPLSFPHISGWCIDDSVEDLGLAEIKLCRVKMIVLTSKLISLADTESSDIQMLRASLAYLGKLFRGTIRAIEMMVALFLDGVVIIAMSLW